jgi:hypothetical protein
MIKGMVVSTSYVHNGGNHTYIWDFNRVYCLVLLQPLSSLLEPQNFASNFRVGAAEQATFF